MKINFNQKFKTPDFKELEIKLSNQKTVWQKGLFFTVLVSLFVFIVLLVYLFFKPLSPDIKSVIDEEINSSNLSFDKKVIEDLTKKQQPTKSQEPTVGKNPFLPF